MANFGATAAPIQATGKMQAVRWATLAPEFAAKLGRVFAALRSQGWDPIIGSAWRDLDTQRRLVLEGKSKVSFSFHNAVDATGNPAALAADVVDSKLLWSASEQNAAFFSALGRASEAEGLTWGGGASFKRSNAFWAKYGIGWDPSHVQAYANSALGVVRAESEKVWAALKGGNLMAVPVIAGRGYFEVLKALPWWYWGGLIALGAVLVFGLSLSRKRLRSTAVSNTFGATT